MYYLKNMEALAISNPLLVTVNHYQPNDNMDGFAFSLNFEEIVTVSFIRESKEFLMHSEYNIAKECELILSSIDLEKDQLIIVFGIGLGYHLNNLQKKISAGSRVFVFEYSTDYFSYFITNVDFTNVFSDKRFLFIVGDSIESEQMILAYFSLNLYNLALNLRIIRLPNYNQLYLDNIKKSIQSIKRMILSKVYSFGNSLQDIFNGVNNNYKNVDACIESFGFDEIEGIYKGYPAIIVASGPSLDKNIKYLNSANDKAVIIACDASLKACEKNKVSIDAVASIERDPEIYDYYYKERKFSEDLVLVGPTLLWPNIYMDFKGKKIMSSKMDDGFEAWWGNQFGHINYMNTGQSSATYAFATAARMGCNPIILIGQDLAYSEGKIHSDLTHHNEQGLNDDHRHDGIFVESQNGELLRSNLGYRMFKEWYELKILSNPGLKVINATEGGALIKGAENMKLISAIEMYCKGKEKVSLFNHLPEKRVEVETYLAKYNQILVNIKDEVNKIYEIKAKALEHKNLLIEIAQNYDFQNQKIDEMRMLIDDMRKGDHVIEFVLHNERTRTVRNFYRQLVIQTITHVKSIGNQLTTDNLERNYQLQKNLMILIEESSDVIIEKYKEIEKFIYAKKEGRGIA